MADTIELDVRGLEPPEPFERIVAALDSLAPGGALRVLIDRRPVPLYKMLQLNGYAYEERVADAATYEITIRQRRTGA